MFNDTDGMEMWKPIDDLSPKGIWNDVTNDKTFRDTYPTISPFSLDILKEAITEFLKDKPVPTYEQSLQKKLNSVRGQLEYDAKYYTPNFEDVKEGDELEILTSWGWVKGKFPGILGQDTHVNLFCKDQSNEGRWKCASIRAKKKKL